VLEAPYSSEGLRPGHGGRGPGGPAEGIPLMNRFRLPILALLCAAFLAAAPAAAAPYGPGSAFPHSGGLLARLIDLLTGGWSKEGMGLDPSGGTTSGDAGMIIDPDGATATGDEGMIIDPSGATAGDAGMGLDPNGATATSDEGMGLDPNGAH
jgi:hypothetical protein